MPSPATRFPVSDHCDGTRFFNPRHHADKSWRDILKWRRTSRATPWPAPSPTLPAGTVSSPPLAPAPNGVSATWIGHATFLLRTPGPTLLTDPVFSDRPSPISWAGPRRAFPPGVALDDLPAIDAILLSHDHYDHCDLRSLAVLARRTPQPHVIAPLGHEDLLARAGFDTGNVTTLDWWQATTLPGHAEVSITLTPSRHWTNRVTGKRNGRLWGGYFVAQARDEMTNAQCPMSNDGGPEGGTSAALPIRIWGQTGQHAQGPKADDGVSHLASDSPADATPNSQLPTANYDSAPAPSLWFAGDTAWDDEMFADIRSRLGSPTLALVPIGAYEPRWFMRDHHCNPEEAVRIHLMVGAHRSVAMHWGTWQLTDEGIDAPAVALAAAKAAAGIADDAFVTLAPGETYAATADAVAEIRMTKHE